MLTKALIIIQSVTSSAFKAEEEQWQIVKT